MPRFLPGWGICAPLPLRNISRHTIRRRRAQGAHALGRCTKTRNSALPRSCPGNSNNENSQPARCSLSCVPLDQPSLRTETREERVRCASTLLVTTRVAHVLDESPPGLRPNRVPFGASAAGCRRDRLCCPLARCRTPGGLLRARVHCLGSSRPLGRAALFLGLHRWPKQHAHRRAHLWQTLARFARRGQERTFAQSRAQHGARSAPGDSVLFPWHVFLSRVPFACTRGSSRAGHRHDRLRWDSLRKLLGRESQRPGAPRPPPRRLRGSPRRRAAHIVPRGFRWEPGAYRSRPLAHRVRWGRCGPMVVLGWQGVDANRHLAAPARRFGGGSRCGGVLRNIPLPQPWRRAHPCAVRRGSRHSGSQDYRLRPRGASFCGSAVRLGRPGRRRCRAHFGWLRVRPSCCPPAMVTLLRAHASRVAIAPFYERHAGPRDRRAHCG